MSAISNKELCVQFMRLLTHEFYATDEAGNKLEGEAESAILMQTKRWRGDLWKKFYELEERLVPRPSAQPRPDYVGQMVEESRRRGRR